MSKVSMTKLEKSGWGMGGEGGGEDNSSGVWSPLANDAKETDDEILFAAGRNVSATSTSGTRRIKGDPSTRMLRVPRPSPSNDQFQLPSHHGEGIATRNK